MQTKRSVFMKKDNREYILETSLMLFLQKGFKSVTMNDIVQKTGLSKGAFYYYFESKEQVFEEVVRYFYKDIFTQNFDLFSQSSLKEFYTDFLKDVDQKFLSVKKIGNTQEAMNINHYLLIFDAIAILPSFNKQRLEHEKEELRQWKKIIKIAQNNGEIKATFSADHIAKMFIFMGDGFGMHIITDAEIENRMPQYQKEIRKLWASLYNLLKA